MPKPARTQPDLADVVALARALERDTRRTSRELRERESRLASELPGGNEDRVTVALAWLGAVEREDEAVRSIHDRAETAVRLTGVLIAAGAILLGWIAALAAFYFDGSGRVNAVAVLAVLVGIPGLLLVPFIIATLPHGIVQRLPGAGAVAAIVRGLSPGRLAQWLWRVLARERGDAVGFVSDRLETHQQRYSGVQKWALLRWSQWFALWFQITAFVASLMLVIFTDLAFGWSTTLTTGDAALDARRVHRITTAMATPWGWLMPDAQPSLALIEESRYFRAAAEPLSPAQAARLGGWWKFVVLTIAIYGLLPRVLTVALAQARLRAAARATVMAAPGFSAVLRRLHSTRIETVAVAPERRENDAPALEPIASAPRTASGYVRAIINWSAVPVEMSAITAAFPGAQVLEAGGAASVEEDATVVAKLGSALNSERGDVLVLVKGWEPPLLEIMDFLKALRSTLSAEATEIVVLPVGLEHLPGLGPATPRQLQVWRDKLARISDPSLRVAADREEVAA